MLTKTTYRRCKGAALISISFAVLSGILAAQAVVDSRSHDLSYATGPAVLAGVGVWIAVWAWRVRIVADVTGVTLFNWFTTRRLEWSSIASIDPPGGYGRIINGILFTTTEGRTHVATAFSPGPLDPESVTAGVVDELRVRQARYGSQSQTSGP